MNNQPIHVYLPSHLDTSGFPDDLLGEFDVPQVYSIEVSWIFYLMLRNQGLDVQVCSSIPRSGIIFIHKMFSKTFIWNPSLFVVSMQWDHKRDDRAQVHLVSNHYKTRASSLGWFDRITFSGRQYFVQPPMHSELIQRNPARGDLFERVAFIGAGKNLDPALRSESFRREVEGLGVKFEIIDDPGMMNDYSQIDAVLAVRRFGRLISHKPPQKLVNAWRAGVPAILGHEVGYQELRESDFDYLEADTVEEVVEAIRTLKNNPDLRREMIDNGLRRAECYTTTENERQWGALFRDFIIPDFNSWIEQSRAARYLFLGVRWIRYAVRVSSPSFCTRC